MEQQLPMNDENNFNYNYENQINIIEDNVNVSKTSDIKEFLILTGGIILIICGIFFMSDLAMQVFLNNISYETQVKIENSLNPIKNTDKKYNEKDLKKIAELEKIQEKIKSKDEDLKNFRKLKIGISKDKEINAYIYPNGEIYFTEGILKELSTEDQKAFILAHEIAHYKNRDHLKSIGRSILAITVISLMGMGNSEHISKIMYSIYDINNLKYSRNQEIDADMYANKIVKEIYGTNKGAIELFKIIDKKQNLPEFIHYFSTHPSPSTRIKLIESNSL